MWFCLCFVLFFTLNCSVPYRWLDSYSISFTWTDACLKIKKNHCLTLLKKCGNHPVKIKQMGCEVYFNSRGHFCCWQRQRKKKDSQYGGKMNKPWKTCRPLLRHTVSAARYNVPVVENTLKTKDSVIVSQYMQSCWKVLRVCVCACVSLCTSVCFMAVTLL